MSDTSAKRTKEFWRTITTGDNSGARKVESKRKSSPFHPDSAEADDAGKLRFYQGDKEVFMHPDETFHAEPFHR